MTVTRQFAAFAASLTWRATPQSVRAKVLDHVLDTIGSMCAGATTREHAALVHGLGMASTTAPATVIGLARRATARDAAFANAFAGRIHTYDDTLEAGPVHSGSCVISAALASAEHAGATGETFLGAVLAGYEVAARVTIGLGAGHYARGFQTSGTCNTFGTAVAAACARGLDAQKIGHALGIAGGMTAGIRQHQIDGAMSDSALNGAHAALAGVMGADLAAAGLPGPAGILDGRLGVGALMADRPDYAAMTEGLGTTFRFVATALKPYPTCRFTHGPLHEAIRLRRAYGLTPEKIKRVTIQAFRQSIEVSDRPRFDTRTLALLSHQYTLAVALHRGAFTLADLGPDAIADPAISDLACRITVAHDAALEASYPAAWPHRIRIELADGRTLEAVSDHPPGGAGQPMVREAIVAKLRANAAPLVGEARTSELIDEVARLPDRADVSGLTRLLGGPMASGCAHKSAVE